MSAVSKLLQAARILADLGNPQEVKLEKGLDYDEAYRRAQNRATRDWRSFTYDPKTGIGILL